MARESLPKPSEIKKVLDEYVIGQDRAKKVLSVAGLQTIISGSTSRLRFRVVRSNWRRGIFF